MNKKTLLLSLIISLFSFIIVNGQTNIKVSGTASKGGKIVRVSANIEYKLMETYPSCVITIYNAGTLTLSTIYSDEIGTAKSNPFTAGTDASYWFYVAPGRYDIKFSGTGITVPFTISDFFVATGGGGGGSGVTSFNSRTGAVVPIPGDYTFSGLDFTGSNFNSITTRSASDLNAGTIPDARFPAILPALSGINLTNLNASNLASGTVADARLSTNVPLLNAINIFTNTNYFTGTAVGIGTVTPRRKLDILDPSSTQLRLTAVDNSVYTDLYVDSGGTLNILPTGNVVFDSVGNQINPLNNYDQNLGQVNKKYLSLWAAELNVETLVAQNTIATIGGRILVAPTNQLIADLAPATTTINVKYNNFANGDRIYMETAGQVEFLAVTSGASVIPGGYSYTVTRNLDGTGANQWYAGDALVNTGVSGSGFIDLYSINGVNTPTHLGPTIVGNVRNSTTYNDWTERWAIGNLNGLFGYGTNTYGAAFGVPTGAWIKIDSVNGVRIGYAGTTKTQIDAAGNASFTGTITAAAGNIAGWTINSASIQSGTTYVASNFAVPAGQVAWFGKSTNGQQGVVLGDASSRYISMVVNDGTIYPYIYMSDGTRARVVIGGLNNAWASEGSVNSMGMKIWDSAGLKLVEFSDVANGISGWNISSTKISGTGIDLVSGANAYLAFGSTPPTANNSGTGIFLDRTGLYGLLSNVVQVKLDATTGKITAGAGAVTLSATGLDIVADTGSFDNPKSIHWTSANTGGMYIIGQSATNVSGIYISSLGLLGGGGDTSGRINLSASANQAAGDGVTLRLNSTSTSSWAGFSGDQSKFKGLLVTNKTLGSDPTGFLQIEPLTTTNNAVTNVLVVQNDLYTGTAAANFGAGILFKLNSTTTQGRDAASISGIWTTATDASRTGAITFKVVNNAGSLTELARIGGDGIIANSVQWNTGTRPTCDSSNRGKVWYVAGGAGVADTFEVCKKDAGDAYAWATLY